MPRTIPTTFRQAAEAQYNDEVNLCFLTISHPFLAEPVRVVWDTKDFIFGGERFIGFPFDIELLTDDDQPPRAKLSIQNIDPRIGDTIRSLPSAPRLKLELLSSADFDLNTDPRVEIEDATVVYRADKMFLTNVSVDVLTVSGDIVGWDYLQRVWPGRRATQSLLPGLFR